MICKKCQNNLFYIQIIDCCDDCIENAAYDEDKEDYTYDLKIIEEKCLNRDHVQEQGECIMGTAYENGCHMYICKKCNYKSNMPIIGDYC
jgi:hypothetical protein